MKNKKVISVILVGVALAVIVVLGVTKSEAKRS